jgi:hypothetical protein
MSPREDTKDAIDQLSLIEPPNWDNVREKVIKEGTAILPGLLSSSTCNDLKALYSQLVLFRKKIIMGHHGYGQGEYQYFSYPLPPMVGALRELIYPQLVPVANQWHQQLGLESRFPDTLSAFTRRCHDAGQVRPTPLMLKYEAGDFNCLHQDLYGEHVFPLQVVVQLSRPGADFNGGEFVTAEQRPRMQSRVDVINLNQGDAIIFAVNLRPKLGSRGYYRVNMRHGVSTIRSGHRITLGIIFHDAN